MGTVVGFCLSTWQRVGAATASGLFILGKEALFVNGPEQGQLRPQYFQCTAPKAESSMSGAG